MHPTFIASLIIVLLAGKWFAEACIPTKSFFKNWFYIFGAILAVLAPSLIQYAFNLGKGANTASHWPTFSEWVIVFAVFSLPMTIMVIRAIISVIIKSRKGE